MSPFSWLELPASYVDLNVAHLFRLAIDIPSTQLCSSSGKHMLRTVKHDAPTTTDARRPLLPQRIGPSPPQKAFLRARPLWLVPFALMTAIVVSYEFLSLNSSLNPLRAAWDDDGPPSRNSYPYILHVGRSTVRHDRFALALHSIPIRLVS